MELSDWIKRIQMPYCCSLLALLMWHYIKKIGSMAGLIILYAALHIFSVLLLHSPLKGKLLFRDKAYFVDLFVRASNMPAIRMYEKVHLLQTSCSLAYCCCICQYRLWIPNSRFFELGISSISPEQKLVLMFCQRNQEAFSGWEN
jgi:hypothetical protein